MSLSDREYMYRREPSAVKAHVSRASTLQIACIWISVLFLAFKAFQWWDWKKHKLPVPANTPQVLPQSKVLTPQPPEQARAFHSSPNQAAGSLAQPKPNTHTVTKCVANGQVTFTDKECANGAKTSSVTVNTANVGTVAPAMTTSTEVHVTNNVVINQVAPEQRVNTVALRQAECDVLDAEIKQIDATSRQPQTAQTQDWLSERKKNARSRQFALKC